MTGMVRIKLKPGRDKALRQGNPWLFSGAIADENGPSKASLATVRAANGDELGVGLYSRRSQIRVRMLHHGTDTPLVDRAFFAQRIDAARALRAALVPAETTGVRLINAEGDGLPGWTVDRFGDVLVSQITSAGLEKLADEALGALTDALPTLMPPTSTGGETSSDGAAEGLPEPAILAVNSTRVRRREGIDEPNTWITGQAVETARFLEHGLQFSAELGGQKTGFYLDQRDNRMRAGQLAGDRKVLDLFAHTGAFSAHALRGGASQVVAVESSARLIDRGGEDLAANNLAIDRLQWAKANVFEDLRHREERFDLVICDPPSLVENKSAQRAGARAYKDLNRLAFKRVTDGGFLLTFSCSGGVDSKLFRQILFSAADEAGVRASLIEPLSAAADHPVDIAHPQGEYLKGWLVHVAGRR